MFYNQSQGQHNKKPIVSPKEYFDKDGHVIEDLFDKKAEELAKSFREDNSEKITSTQIRKFYDEVLRLKLQIESANNQDEKFKEILPYIKMLIPKVVYSKKRKTANQAFESFIKENIRGISNREEFKVFCDLFECVVAYCKQYLEIPNREE